MRRVFASFNGTARIRVLVALLFLLLSLAGYDVLLRLDSIPYSPHSDVVTYHLAAKQVLHRSLEQGLGIPYWRSDQLSGTPAFTSPNALYTNPLHLAFLIANPTHAVGLTFLIELLVGAFGCYLTGRALGLGRWPCVFLGVAGLFEFKLILAVYAGWLGPLAGISTVPLLFAAAFWLARKPGLGPALALAASGMLCLHGGQLQVPFYAGGFVAAYLFGVAVGQWRRGQRDRARRLSLWVLAASVLAIASALYLLWPMLGEAPLVSRSRASSEFLQSGHRLGLRHLLTLLWPEVLGTPLDGSYYGGEIWEDNAYFGLLPLVLAPAGARLAWRRPVTRFLVVGFLLSLLLALDTPLLQLIYSLPAVSLFRSPARMLFLTSFFGIVLAGVGLEAVAERLRGRSARLAHVVSATLVLLVASEGLVHAHRYLDAKPLFLSAGNRKHPSLGSRSIALSRGAHRPLYARLRIGRQQWIAAHHWLRAIQPASLSAIHGSIAIRASPPRRCRGLDRSHASEALGSSGRPEREVPAVVSAIALAPGTFRVARTVPARAGIRLLPGHARNRRLRLSQSQGAAASLLRGENANRAGRLVGASRACDALDRRNRHRREFGQSQAIHASLQR